MLFRLFYGCHNAAPTTATSAAPAITRSSCLTSLAIPGDAQAAEPWSLTPAGKKLINIGAKVVGHGRYVRFQMAEVASLYRDRCSRTSCRSLRDCGRHLHPRERVSIERRGPQRGGECLNQEKHRVPASPGLAPTLRPALKLVNKILLPGKGERRIMPPSSPSIWGMSV
jgi:hypothetical protein